ncbi:MAG: DsbA family protein [Acidimicrobiia bacterium]|nr:DsbA family protein [Acidimicrobiia bacterium]
MTTSFAVTWDYRCPFARNASEHVLTALEGGADWDVTWVPFSLNQAHVEEGQPDVWDDPEKAPALVAMQAGIVVRDHFPDVFYAVQRALFAARHDEGRDIREEDVIRDVLTANGADADAVFAEIATGQPLKIFRTEHERAVADHQVFGVPTFIAGDQAVFVRVMHRPGKDAEHARATIERIVDLVRNWPELNEFKHTSIPR